MKSTTDGLIGDVISEEDVYENVSLNHADESMQSKLSTIVEDSVTSSVDSDDSDIGSVPDKLNFDDSNGVSGLYLFSYFINFIL